MSAFCSGLCNEISRCCYDFYHAPFTKKNLLIGGGILLGIIILIIIIVVAVGPTHHGIESGSEIIKYHPLVDGANSLSYNMKMLLMNKINYMSDNHHSLSTDIKDYLDGTLNCRSCQTDFERLRKGLVATQVFSLTSSDCGAQYKDSVSQTLEQIDLFRRIFSNSTYKVALVKQADDIAKHFDSKVTGAILSVWGGHNIDSRLAVLRMYYDLGVRIMALVSSDSESNFICYPPWINDDGLTSFGNEVIDEMNRLGMIIDLTGCPLKVQKSVLSRTKAPVIYSHSASKKLVSGNELNFDGTIYGDHKDKLGLVMIPFTPSQLSSNNSATMKEVRNHLAELLKVLPSSKIGIGSNFDNMTRQTEKLTDVSTFPLLFDHLWNPPKGDKAFTEQQLKQLASTNFVNVFKAVEKESKNLRKTAPDESLIEESDIKSVSCYSDFSIRYSPNIPTDKPTQKPTTTATTTVKTTTKPTEKPKT